MAIYSDGCSSCVHCGCYIYTFDYESVRTYGLLPLLVCRFEPSLESIADKDTESYDGALYFFRAADNSLNTILTMYEKV